MRYEHVKFQLFFQLRAVISGGHRNIWYPMMAMSMMMMTENLYASDRTMTSCWFTQFLSFARPSVPHPLCRTTYARDYMCVGMHVWDRVRHVTWNIPHSFIIWTVFCSILPRKYFPNQYRPQIAIHCFQLGYHTCRYLGPPVPWRLFNWTTYDT